MKSVVTQVVETKLHPWDARVRIASKASVLSKTAHLRGYVDLSVNQNLLVGNDASYTSLSFAEVSPFGRLTHLDLNPSPYEECINCACFNESSSTVAVSVGQHSVFLWDVQSHTDVQCLRSNAMVRQLQRSIRENCWMGVENQSLVWIDATQNATAPIPTADPVSSFALSPDRQLLCVGNSSKSLSLYDVRELHTQMLSLPLPCIPVSISWDPSSRFLCVNGKDCVVAMDIIQSAAETPEFSVIPTPHNVLYPRNGLFFNDSLLLGDDSGCVSSFPLPLAASPLRSTVSTVSSSPITSLLAFSSTSLSDAFLVATDTDVSLLSVVARSDLSPSEVSDDSEDAEIVDLEREQPVEAWMLQGVRGEYMRCSWEEHGVCDQQVFVCRTCRDQLDRLVQEAHPEWSRSRVESECVVGGLCEQCAYHCHQARGHDVVELGLKRQFACDCGNALFRRLDPVGEDGEPVRMHECSLCPEKPLHAGNRYNHNWRERWCYCDGEERLPMVQCVRCYDWFHESCAKERFRAAHGYDVDLEDESVDFVCEACERGDDVVLRSGDSVVSRPGDSVLSRSGDSVVSKPGDGVLSRPGDDVVSRSGDSVLSRPGDSVLSRPDDGVTSKPPDIPKPDANDVTTHSMTYTNDTHNITNQNDTPTTPTTDDEETRLEKQIRARLKKHDKPGAMKLIMRYILKQSLSESASQQRNIVVQNDVARAAKMLEKVINKVKKEGD